MPVVTFSEVVKTRTLGPDFLTLAEWIADMERMVMELRETVAALTIEVNRLKDANEYLAKRMENDAK